ERMAHDGLRVPATRAPGAAAALAQLAATEIDPEGAAEMFLEEVAGSLVVAPLTHAPLGATSAQAPAPSPTTRAQLPSADVPTGFVWPAHTGRATLSALGEGGGLAGDAGVETNGDVRLIVDNYVLQTSLRDRFDDVDSARQALV